jgi:acetyltransferase-like isoleucine patch superfamily enzyme
VGAGVFIGSMCWVAEADIKDDVMVASRSAIQGGGRTHGMERVDVPMNRQAGAPVTVTIGPDVWIGTGATILADVAPGTVVAAGAVVTTTYPPHSILAGVPARVLRQRGPADARMTEPNG